KRAMQNALHAKNKMGFVDGTLITPTKNFPKFQSWTKYNSMVISWIFNSLSRELHDSVAYADNAHDIWIVLEERFPQGNALRVQELKRDLATLTQQTKSVSFYYTNLKTLWDELQLYDPIPKCICGCTCGMAKAFIITRETEKIHQFLMGLNDVVTVVRSQILNMDPLPYLSKVYSMITNEEKYQTVASSRASIIEATTLEAKTNVPNSWVGSSNTRSKERCDHSKRIVHTKSRCFELLGYPTNWKGGSGRI
ncbi:UBN2_3 domain-containing protein, partial [Cephalotus follicularis]